MTHQPIHPTVAALLAQANAGLEERRLDPVERSVRRVADHIAALIEFFILTKKDALRFELNGISIEIRRGSDG